MKQPPFRNFILRLLLVWSCFLGCLPARASTSSRMDSYWSGALGQANVTGPTAYKGQSQGYYTMGNLSWRTPQQNLQLAGVQLPSISAGCGGIDIFTGGFSFINSDQLVAEMKAVASNAVGYGFNFALKHLCPLCSDIMTQLQDFAQKINSTNIGSCQASSALLDSVFNRTEASNHQLCQELGTGHGYFSDMVQGWAKCQSATTSTLASMPASDQQFIPSQKNIAWEAIRHVPYLYNDNDFAALVMTLTGTVIENCTGDTAGSCQFSVIQPAADEPHTIAALLDGGTVNGIACDNDQCLNPNPTGRTFNIATSSAFKARVTAMLDDIVLKILARQTLSTDEQSFLQSTPLPIYKMARVYTTSQGALAQTTMDNYADVIATMAALYFIEDAIHQIDAGARNLAGVDKEQLKDWSDHVAQLQATLHAREQIAAQQETAYETIIDRTQRVEAVLAGSVGSRFAQSYAFTSGFASR